MNGRGGLNSTALALIPLAIAINIAVGQLVVTARVLPIYLDSIGTVLVGALMGPWVALITGALSNVIWSLTGLPNSGAAVWFSYVAAVIGLIAGFAGRAGLFTRESPRWLSAIIGAVFFFALAVFVLMFLGAEYNETDGFTIFPAMQDLVAQQPIVFIVAAVAGAALGYFVLQRAGYAGLTGLLTGVLAAILSAPMAAYVFGGVTGSGTDLIVAAFRESGAGILASSLAQGAVSDPFDKMTSFLLVWLIVQSLPRRLLARFPNMRPATQNQPSVGGATTSR
jgi:energy-coupling factor transport system substrate-specific component